jgi:hypothetical protein
LNTCGSPCSWHSFWCMACHTGTTIRIFLTYKINQCLMLKWWWASIFSIFSVMNNVKEINSYHLPTSLFNRPPTSDRHVISSFLLQQALLFLCHNKDWTPFNLNMKHKPRTIFNSIH